MNLIEQFDGIIFDLDGVLYLGSKPAPHAAEAFGTITLPVMFLTNNASRSADEVVAQLASVGITGHPEEVLSSAMVAVHMAEERFPGGKVLPIAGPGVMAALKDANLIPVHSADDAPDVVVHGFYPEVGWKDLSEAALAIERGAAYIASNLDATLPMERGFMVGQGSLVRAVENATGVKAASGGKPEPEIFRTATKHLGATAPGAVGDRLNTDVRGANAADIPSCHVLTGVNSARDVVLAVPEERPHYLLVDLRELNAPYRAPVRDADGAWSAAGARASVNDAGVPTVTVDGIPVGADAPIPVTAYRALAKAAWEAVDRGLPRETLASHLPEFTVVSFCD